MFQESSVAFRPEKQDLCGSTVAISSDSHLFSVPIKEVYVPLTSSPTDNDWILTKQNRAPAHLTSRLQELVPLLQIINFQLETVTTQETVGTVPLLASTMNQNGTHQASIFYIMADYIAGTAVYAGLAGTYIVGLHDRAEAQPIQLWLKSNRVMHLKPGTGLLRGRSVLGEDERELMRERLLKKGRCDVPMKVEIYQGTQLTALAEPVIGVYLDNPYFPDQKMDYFQRENSKLSAKLIAGLRSDTASQAVAGEQGQALAQRFTEIIPQLPHLIISRGRHLQKHLQETPHLYKQVVTCGIGLDTKPLHFSHPTQKWFGLDLLHSLKFRRAQFQLIGGDSATMSLVATDLRRPGWGQCLIHAGFNVHAPSLFILEGFTMYLQVDELGALFDEIHDLCQHSSSVLWMDHVTPNLFQLTSPEVQGFLRAISRLGEPFVTGFDCGESISSKWESISMASSAAILKGEVPPHPVYDQHRMSLLKPQQ